MNHINHPSGPNYQPDEVPPPLPSVWQQVSSATRAVVTHAVSGFQSASVVLKQQRLEICGRCPELRPGPVGAGVDAPGSGDSTIEGTGSAGRGIAGHRTGDRCAACGCFLHWKAAWQTSTCPRGRWPGEQPCQRSETADEIALRWTEARPLKWAVGMTTSPRRPATLERSARSLMQAGFSPLLCVEPETALPVSLQALPRVQRVERLGAFGNWLQTVQDLFDNDPDAEAILVVQDDVIFAPDLRRFLEHDLWPAQDCGVVSLYSPQKAGYEDDGPVGCRQVNGRWLIGACAYLFPRVVAEELVRLPLAREWRGRARGQSQTAVDRKAIDTFVGHALEQMQRSVWYYNPSLAQHISPVSTLGHGGATGIRRSARFQGEEVSPFVVYSAQPPARRFDLPSGRSRGAGWRPSGVPVAAVICAHESPDLTIRAIEHLARYRGDVPLRLIYVDNGSRNETVTAVQQAAERLELPAQVIRNDHNAGFTRAVNQGLIAAAGAHVLLLNNDCFVGPRCVRNLLQHLETTPRCAATGPLTWDGGHQSLHLATRRAQAGLTATDEVGGSLPKTDLVAMAERCRKQASQPETMLAFFCTLLHRAALGQVGLLLELPEFHSGLAADDEWCSRAARYGWECRLVMNAYAEHLHSESFRRLGIDRRQLQRIAIAKLHEVNR